MAISPLVMILVALVASQCLAELLKLIGLPRVVGHISAGLLLGILATNTPLFSEQNVQILSFLANLGVILLFYYIGLKTEFSAFKKNAKKAISISALNTIIPFLITLFVMNKIFHLPFLPSALMGVAVSVSAQAVAIDLLEELKIIKTKLGQSIIVTGAVDDILELVLITLLLTALQVSTTGTGLGGFLVGIGLFMAFVLIARIWLVPAALKFFDKEKSSTTRFTGSIIIVLIIAILSESLGISSLIGALIAGMLIRQIIHKDVAIPDWEETDISKSVHTISFGLLIPLFFLWVGLSSDISAISQNIKLILILTAISTVGTVGTTMFGVLMNGGSWKEGLLMGWGLNPKGDIELIIAALGLKTGLLTPGLFTSIVVMSLITSIISPIVFKLLVNRFNVRKAMR